MARTVAVPIRSLHRHLRIWIALIVGVALFFLLPGSWPFNARMLIGWDCGVALFLLLLYLWMRRLTPQQICSHYNEVDPSAPVILVVTTAAALLSLLAI